MAEEKKGQRERAATLAVKAGVVLSAALVFSASAWGTMPATESERTEKKVTQAYEEYKDQLKLVSLEVFYSSYAQDSSQWLMPSGYKAIPPDHLYKKSVYEIVTLMDDVTGSQHYLKERGGFDAFLQKEHRDPDINLRAAATNHVIESMKEVDDVALKAEVINDFVYKAVQYNDIKAAEQWDFYDLHGYWDQTPQETVAVGKGVCVDYIKLKAEMLLRAGVSANDISLMSLVNKEKEEAHQVLRVDTGEYGVLILDNTKPISEATYFKRNPDWDAAQITNIDGKTFFVEKVPDADLTDSFKSLDDIPYKKYKRSTYGLKHVTSALIDKYAYDDVPSFSGSWKQKPGQGQSFETYYKEEFKAEPMNPRDKSFLRFSHSLKKLGKE